MMVISAFQEEHGITVVIERNNSSRVHHAVTPASLTRIAHFVHGQTRLDTELHPWFTGVLGWQAGLKDTEVL